METRGLCYLLHAFLIVLSPWMASVSSIESAQNSIEIHSRLWLVWEVINGHSWLKLNITGRCNYQQTGIFGNHAGQEADGACVKHRQMLL